MHLGKGFGQRQAKPGHDHEQGQRHERHGPARIDGGEKGYTEAERNYLVSTLNAGSLPAQLEDEPRLLVQLPTQCRQRQLAGLFKRADSEPDRVALMLEMMRILENRLVYLPHFIVDPSSDNRILAQLVTKFIDQVARERSSVLTTLEAILPNGQSQVISHVADFNFNWHNTYVYKETAAPLLPKGTLIKVTAWHDNTAANKGKPGNQRGCVRTTPTSVLRAVSGRSAVG